MCRGTLKSICLLGVFQTTNFQRKYSLLLSWEWLGLDIATFLQVYIDVPYGSDPEIKFPLVILPASRHGSWVSGVPMPFGNKSHWNDHHPQPGAAGPPRYLYPPEPGTGQHPYPCPPPAQPMAANSGMHPPPFYSPAAAAYPGPVLPPSMQPNTTDQLPPPQYDQVAHPAPTAPPLYPTLPTADFLSVPSAPQYVPGAAGSDFLSSTPSAPQQYPGPATAPSFLSSPGSMSDPGYDPPTYEMVFPNAPASGSTPNSAASDEPTTTKPPS